MAHRKAQMYVAEKQGSRYSSEEFEAIRLVYLMIELSIQEIAGRLSYEGQHVQNFRQLALVLHPDKNSHPMSKDAFQKLLSAFDLTRKNGI